MFKRSSGVLAHVTSLPSPHGVGTMGKTARDFVDFLAAAHQTYWQVLPLGHTGFGDSPYQNVLWKNAPRLSVSQMALIERMQTPNTSTSTSAPLPSVM